MGKAPTKSKAKSISAKGSKSPIASETTNLSLYREDQNNVSVATDEDIARLAEKLRRNPRGLAAMRIAYVTDDPPGARTVNTGNKRLRILKQIAADGGLAVDGAWLVSPAGDVPAEWFCDITFMTPEQRKEFRLNTNISDGSLDAEKLLAQYTRDDLAALMSAEAIDELLGKIDMGGDGVKDSDEYGTDFTLPDGDKSEYGQMAFVVTEKQREEINFAVSLAPYCDGFSEVDNTNRNGAALFHIVREWLAVKVKEQRSYEEVEAAFHKLREDFCAALKKSGRKASDVDAHLGTNGMAGHYFGASQFMLPTREAFEKMATIMPLDGMDYQQCKATVKEYHRMEMLRKKNQPDKGAE